MSRYGLLGKKLGHSFSREIHSAIGGYEYELIQLDEGQLKEFLIKKDFDAVNVTIPYKKTVIPYLDRITAEAESIGSVNCIRNDGGRLIGHNTDYDGLAGLIRHCGAELAGKKVLILGTGGTGATADAVCKAMGADQIIKVSRKERHVCMDSKDMPAGEKTVSYEEAVKYHGDAQIMINATPCGMYPDIFRKPIDLNTFCRLEAMIDVIYNPLRSMAVSEALHMGVKAEGGLYMLVEQAVKASEFFFDTAYGPHMTERIFRSIYDRKANIVLTGMPASGKTTIAGILAQKTGRTVYDTDEMVEKDQGRKISEIFEKYGEEYFRDIESKVIRQAAAYSSAIIATGGGAVMREENIKALKMNGEIFFRDRDPEKLTPTADRPKAYNMDEIRKRYDERYDTYVSTADHIIKEQDCAEKAADEILEVLS